MLQAFLAFYRASLLDRAWGLDKQQLAANLAPSSLSLARLIGHMAWVEYIWFRVRLDGQDFPDPFANLDWDADADAEMTLAETWSVADLLQTYADAIADSDARIAAASSLDVLTVGVGKDGEAWNLRWLMIHMIEEYARHCGHADFIRESIDGDVCE